MPIDSPNPDIYITTKNGQIHEVTLLQCDEAGTPKAKFLITNMQNGNYHFVAVDTSLSPKEQSENFHTECREFNGKITEEVLFAIFKDAKSISVNGKKLEGDFASLDELKNGYEQTGISFFIVDQAKRIVKFHMSGAHGDKEFDKALNKAMDDNTINYKEEQTLKTIEKKALERIAHREAHGGR